MELITAESAGFCFGVKRAVDMVGAQIEENKAPLYTFGPIIHNEEVVRDLESKGAVPIPEDADLSIYEPGTIVIRSHGVTKAVYDSLKEHGFHIVDATCPFVKKIHKIVSEKSEEGYYILIAGDANHPEVQGIIGWINGPYLVIDSEESLDTFLSSYHGKVCLVSQTTFNYKKFSEFVDLINKKVYDVNVVNTICNATEERQEEAKRIAAKADAMFVIGGRNSSNTRKLFEICKKECNDTFYIQTAEDIEDAVLQSVDRVGITAGASTPNYIIEEVQKKCQK